MIQTELIRVLAGTSGSFLRAVYFNNSTTTLKLVIVMTSEPLMDIYTLNNKI